MRLIDADALQNEYKKAHGKRLLIIDVAPTIHQGRTRGKWIDCNNRLKCSVCGDKAPMYFDANREEYDAWFSPYCPNCGADMREDGE